MGRTATSAELETFWPPDAACRRRHLRLLFVLFGVLVAGPIGLGALAIYAWEHAPGPTDVGGYVAVMTPAGLLVTVVIALLSAVAAHFQVWFIGHSIRRTVAWLEREPVLEDGETGRALCHACFNPGDHALRLVVSFFGSYLLVTDRRLIRIDHRLAGARWEVLGPIDAVRVAAIVRRPLVRSLVQGSILGLAGESDRVELEMDGGRPGFSFGVEGLFAERVHAWLESAGFPIDHREA